MQTEPLTETATEIAKRSKSNLAFALGCLPAERRKDMVSFYAFCRIVDDLADSEDISEADRRVGLAKWRAVVRGDATLNTPVAHDMGRLASKYNIDPALLEQIIDGMEADLTVKRYQTWEELRGYCYKVASVVGLVSLEIFGVTDPRGKEYAINLGYALQLTNILRDVRADWENEGRIYLPAEDMAAHGYTEEMLARREMNAAFFSLMKFESDRALGFYARAVAATPPKEKRPLLAAEAMRRIYHGILVKMRADGFKVFDQRYRLSRWRKAGIVAAAWVRGLVG